MPSAAQAEGYRLLFDHFDTDHDDQIEQDDIDVLVQRWCAALHRAPGDSAWRQMTRRSNRLWQHLRGHTNAEGDKQVSKTEWVDSHDDAGFVQNVAVPWALAVYDLGDAKGDGRVSLQAWMTTHTVSGYGQAESLAAFQELDHDRDGYVEKKDFIQHIEGFYRPRD
ncbi:hypothetical protein GCM10029978_055520 [Actinoallomurus acanthiterrae]